MSKLLIAGVLMTLSAAAAAGETGVINQSGQYEATMRFYLHPAHGFPGKSDTDPSAVVADAKDKPTVHGSDPDRQLQAAAKPSSTSSRYPLRQVAARDPK